jgi:hypothetical protein
MIVKIICAWCKREMGEREGNYPPGTTSHGICDSCAALYFPKCVKTRVIVEVMKC